MAAQTMYFGLDHHGHGAAAPGLWDRLFNLVFRAVAALLQPLDLPHPLQTLAAGEVVPWSLVTATALTHIGLYCGILALGTAWLMRRREIGLPD